MRSGRFLRFARAGAVLHGAARTAAIRRLEIPDHQEVGGLVDLGFRRLRSGVAMDAERKARAEPLALSLLPKHRFTETPKHRPQAGGWFGDVKEEGGGRVFNRE